MEQSKGITVAKPKEITPEVEKIMADALQLAKNYEAYEIKSALDYNNSGTALKNIKDNIKTVDTKRKDITSKIDIAKKAIMELFRPASDALSLAENKVSSAMQSYQQAERRKAEAEQARLAEIQRKETARLEKLAREKEEHARELERQAQELEKTNSAEAERLRMQAEKATEKAEALQEKAQQTQAITSVVEVNIPKVTGLTTRLSWKFKIVNETLIPREYLIPNEKMLGELARATKGTLKIAGIEFYSEENMTGCR